LVVATLAQPCRLATLAPFWNTVKVFTVGVKSVRAGLASALSIRS